MTPFNGRRALIMGGTSGIGREIARRLAEGGARVAAVGRVPAHVEETHQAIVAAGGDSLALVCDATDPAQVREMLRTIRDTWGGLDIVVNSQGAHHKRPSAEVSDDLFAHVIQVNLNSVFTVCREAYPLLRQSSGCIINLASMASFFGLRDAAAYTASKGGVAQLTKALAVDWAADGIRCNAIAPGWIVTPLSEVALNNPDYRDPILRRIPLGRLGTVGDVAGLALFLASDQAQYITGAVIPVDGGAMAGV